MRGLRTLIAVITGNAVVITKKKDDLKADVTIGKSLNKQFVVSSMIGAVKALMV